MELSIGKLTWEEPVAFTCLMCHTTRHQGSTL